MVLAIRGFAPAGAELFMQVRELLHQKHCDYAKKRC